MSQVVVGDRARHYFNVLVNPKVKYYTWITILSTYKVPNFLSKYLHLRFLCSKETKVNSNRPHVVTIGGLEGSAAF